MNALVYLTNFAADSEGRNKRVADGIRANKSSNHLNQTTV